MICSGSFNVGHVFRLVLFEEEEWEHGMKAGWLVKSGWFGCELLRY